MIATYTEKRIHFFVGFHVGFINGFDERLVGGCVNCFFEGFNLGISEGFGVGILNCFGVI